MAVTPGSSELLVANYADGTVTVINTSAATVTATVALPTPAGGQPPAPMGIVVLPSGADAYVVDHANSEVDELSLRGATANTFVAEDAVGNQGTVPGTPANIDLVKNPTAGTEIYVGDRGTTRFRLSRRPAIPSQLQHRGRQHAGGPRRRPRWLFCGGRGGRRHRLLVSTTTNTVFKTLAGTPATCLAMQGDSVAAVEASGSVAAVPTLLSYELQAVQTTAGGGFMSALSLPVNVSLGVGQVP